MTDFDDLGKRLPPPTLWTGQPLHFAALATLLLGTWAAWQAIGSPVSVVFWIAVAIPVAHQLFVWISWRRQLQTPPRTTVGFTIYAVTFFLLFVGRPISLLVLAWLDRGSLGLPTAASITLGATLFIPAAYAFYSVARCFGFARAAGADHFDTRYRSMSLVNEGIFRFTNNGMYLYAFLLFWAIALGFGSAAALIVTAFSHAYIWAHYFATEKPDMEYLYSGGGSGGE